MGSVSLSENLAWNYTRVRQEPRRLQLSGPWIESKVPFGPFTPGERVLTILLKRKPEQTFSGA